MMSPVKTPRRQLWNCWTSSPIFRSRAMITDRPGSVACSHRWPASPLRVRPCSSSTRTCRRWQGAARPVYRADHPRSGDAGQQLCTRYRRDAQEDHRNRTRRRSDDSPGQPRRQLRKRHVGSGVTATRWKDRILGKSQEVDLPLIPVWYGTGNNVAVAADTMRRIIHIRLDVMAEKPEERTGFKHPQLIQWIKEHRPRLLSCGLTILPRFFNAGMPQQEVTPFGSLRAGRGWCRGDRVARPARPVSNTHEAGGAVGYDRRFAGTVNRRLAGEG